MKINRSPVAVFLAVACASILGWLPATGSAQPSRIKDLVNIRGVRSNHLIGFGMVFGLKGSGDSKKSIATNKGVANMLTRLGMKTNSEEVVSGNVAAVVVTADLPAFARIGDSLDVKVSTIGDAKSLAGGTLVMTPLKAGGTIYAVAQGAVAVGQASGNGPQVLSVARVPQGAKVEREFIPEIATGGALNLSLKHPDFTTNARIAETINKSLRGFYAESVDVSGVRVTIPPLYRNKIVEFIARLESLRVEADVKARVVFNERTGTVVMGSEVVVLPVTISHGDLSIKVGKGKGGKDKTVVKMQGTTVGELMRAMNAIGVKPADLVGILQSIHASGALQAELKFL